MADTFETLSMVPTIELLGGGKTVDGVIYTGRAKPSGAQFSIFIANVDLVPSHFKLIVPVVADAVNKAAETDGVGYLLVYQDVDNGGQFANKLDVTVTSTSGNSEQEIHPPYGSIFDDRFGKAVAATRANLDAIEAA